MFAFIILFIIGVALFGWLIPVLSITHKGLNFMDAAYKQNIPAMDNALQSWEDINFKDEKGNSALWIAIKNKNTEMLKFLLEKGANPNDLNKTGEYPLLYACCNKCSEITKLLLEFGADITITYQGLSPLQLALVIDSDILKLLCACLPYKGIDINTQYQYGMNLLNVFASSLGGLDNSFSEEQLPLHISKTVDCLLEAGIDINAKDSLGNTPLHTAIARIQETSNNNAILLFITYLLSKGADVNACDNEDNNIGILLLSRRYTIHQEIFLVEPLLKAMIEAGLDIKHKNKYGVSTHSLAKNTGNENLLKLVLSPEELELRKKFNEYVLKKSKKTENS